MRFASGGTPQLRNNGLSDFKLKGLAFGLEIPTTNAKNQVGSFCWKENNVRSDIKTWGVLAPLLGNNG